jgi:hypothetical protein
MGTAFKKLKRSAIKPRVGADFGVMTALVTGAGAFQPYSSWIIMLRFGMLVTAALIATRK